MFRVTARTILQLGAELISSDAVAFYELIKNAFDADSKRIAVNVIQRLPFDEIVALRANLKSLESANSKAIQDVIEATQEKIASLPTTNAPEMDDYISRVNAARSPAALLSLLDSASSIEFTDTGQGMSAEDLREIYLTIGTPSRIKTRAARSMLPDKGRPVLGEKGIGRLSVMRLGMMLQVKTTKEGEANWHLLELDWRAFAEDPAAMLESVFVEPVEGPRKDDRQEHGTRILITALNSEWSRDKLQGVTDLELSKLMDPFSERTLFPISIHHNTTPIRTRAINRLVFEHAHASAHATLSIGPDNAPVLRGQVKYLLEKKEKTFVVQGANLKSSAGVQTLDTLRSLGPFTMEVYWYNRRILEEITGIGDRETVRELIRAWSGGLMMFRDGFRVTPYGGLNDDWLDLDRGAFASQGYKVNRAQLIGKIDISSADNPRLVDQTNREGLRDCPEKAALRQLLRHILEQHLRDFLTTVDKVNRKPVTFAELEDRVEVEERALSNTMDRLREVAKDFPGVSLGPVEQSLRGSLKEIERMMADAKLLAEHYDHDRVQVIHLAGLGMMVEHIAHELVRTTEHTLQTLGHTLAGNLPTETKALLRNVEAQLVSLQKRLSLLDPHTTSGRQVKEPVRLVATIQDIMRGHAARFERRGVKMTVLSIPPDTDVTVKMVRGMFIQVIENLIDNSMYWLEQRNAMEPGFKPAITMTVMIDQREVHVTDNGPGIEPADREDVFRPFFTRKPPGQGKGLGLYISRQLAEYHGATLDLADAKDARFGRHQTFILDLSKVKK